MATQTQQPKSAASQAQPATALAFRSQTQPTIKRPGVNINSTGTTIASLPFGSSLPDTQIPPTTLLRCIYLECALTVASGNAAAVAFNADAPLNLFSVVNFHDAQGTSIVGPFDSFTLAMAQKYFGFVNNSDITTSAVYGSTVGAVATGGSFNMVFRIPVEVVMRTGVGSQINTDTQSPLVLSLTVNSSANIYATAPTGTSVASLSVVVSYGGYWNQSGNPNSFATPTAVGTLNYINWTNYTGLNGTQQFQLANIGLGNSIANILYINRTSAGARSDAAFANPLQIAYRGNVLDQYSQLLWKHAMSEAYGFPGTVSTTSGVSAYLQDTGLGTVVQSSTPALNQGVYNQWFTQDFDFVPGNTLFYGLLNTAVGDSIELTGTWGASSTLYEIINFLAVSGAVTNIQGH
jgi:hypothetical protein